MVWVKNRVRVRVRVRDRVGLRFRFFFLFFVFGFGGRVFEFKIYGLVVNVWVFVL